MLNSILIVLILLVSGCSSKHIVSVQAPISEDNINKEYVEKKKIIELSSYSSEFVNAYKKVVLCFNDNNYECVFEEARNFKVLFDDYKNEGIYGCLRDELCSYVALMEAGVLVAQNRDSDAIKYYRDIINIKHDWEWGYIGLAQVYYKNKSWDLGVKVIEAGIGNVKNELEILNYFLLRGLYNLGLKDEVANRLDFYKESFGENGMFGYFYALMDFDNGDVNKGCKRVENLYQNNFLLTEVKWLYGICLLENDNKDELHSFLAHTNNRKKVGDRMSIILGVENLLYGNIKLGVDMLDAFLLSGSRDDSVYDLVSILVERVRDGVYISNSIDERKAGY